MNEIESTSFLESVDLCFNKAAEALKLPKGLSANPDLQRNLRNEVLR